MSDELRELEREQAWQQVLELQRRSLLRVLEQRCAVLELASGGVWFVDEQHVLRRVWPPALKGCR